MTKNQVWCVLIMLAVGVGLGRLIAQQQYSGGQAVTVTSGSVTANAGTGPSTAWKVDLSSTGANSTAIKVDPSAVTSPVSLASLPALAAGTNKIGTAYPYTSCGTTAVTMALQALPTTATSVTGSTSCLVNLYLHNTSNSVAYTVTVTDGQGSPVAFLNAVTLNPLETREYNFPNGGPKMTTGLKWNASNVAIVGSVEMMQ